MIRVNLLPPEYRQLERTPVGRLVALLVGVLAVGSSAGYWLYFHMGPLQFWEEKRVQLTKEYEIVEKQMIRSKALQAEYNEYRKRRDQIELIGSTRVLWSQKLDELADIIHNGGSKTDHNAWLNNLSAQAPRSAATGGTLNISGFSGGAGYDRLSNFNKALRVDESFFEDFTNLDPPRGQKTPFKDDLEPASGWKFSWTMGLKKAGWREAK